MLVLHNIAVLRQGAERIPPFQGIGDDEPAADGDSDEEFGPVVRQTREQIREAGYAHRHSVLERYFP